jgi:5,10-methylenetetrahydromethanopterin reductase
MNVPSIGVMFQRDVPPEALAARASLIESLGFDDMWVVEDLFFSGGIAQAGAALAATRTLQVGIGILPAMARNPVYAAMELATLARLYPHRVLAGVGHGMQDWMARVGALPRSPLKALEETMLVIGRLLSGETVSLDGDFVTVSEARLQHPPGIAPPLLAGVRGPNSLRLAGRAADGAILAEPTSVAYSLWAREQLASGAAVGQMPRPTLVSYTWLSIDRDLDVAIERVRPMLASIPGGLAEPSVRSQLLPLPFSAELIAVLEGTEDQEVLARQLKREWVRELAIVGTPADCANEIRRRGEAGVDRIVLVPLPDRIDEQVRMFGHEVLPLLPPVSRPES